MQDSNSIDNESINSVIQENVQHGQENRSDNDGGYQKVDSNGPKSITKKPIPNLNELSFVRLIDPIHIPTYLVEQLKDRLFEVDKFYQYLKIACIIQSPNGPELNGGNLLYAITNSRLRQVKGFLWMVIDFLTNSLIVNNFSMDKEYWNRGESTALLEEKSKKVMKDLSLSRIVWITRNPKYCENKGFKRSKNTVMVYEE